MKKKAVAMMLGLSLAAAGTCAYASDDSTAGSKTVVMGEVTEVDDAGFITVNEISMTGSEDSGSEEVTLDADSLVQDVSDPQYTDTEQIYTLTDDSAILWLHIPSEDETDSDDADGTKETADAEAESISDEDAAASSDEDTEAGSETAAAFDEADSGSSESTDEEASLLEQLETAFADTDYIIDEIGSDEIYEADIVLINMDEDGNISEIAVLDTASAEA